MEGGGPVPCRRRPCSVDRPLSGCGHSEGGSEPACAVLSRVYPEKESTQGCEVPPPQGRPARLAMEFAREDCSMDWKGSGGGQGYWPLIPVNDRYAISRAT